MLDPDAARSDAVAQVAARIDRLPATATLWRLVALLALGGFFELYGLFQTAYISPCLLRDGIFASAAASAFGTATRPSCSRPRCVPARWTSAIPSAACPPPAAAC